MLKRVGIVFLNDKLEEKYLNLPEDSQIKKRINYLINRIKEKPAFGQPIAKKLIPKEYKNQGINNAYWVELSKFGWRLIYSLTSENKDEITAIIVEWFTHHKDYERRFRY